MGQRLNIIVLAEGAIDTEGRPITCDAVKDVKEQKSFLRSFALCPIF